MNMICVIFEIQVFLFCGTSHISIIGELTREATNVFVIAVTVGVEEAVPLLFRKRNRPLH